MKYCITKGENAFNSKSPMLYYVGMTAKDICIPVYSANIKDALVFHSLGHAETHAKKNKVDGVINRLYERE